MSEFDLKKQVQKGYQSINDQWMKIHVRLLLICMFFSAAMEIIIFFVLYFTSVLTYTIGEYWIMYVICPFLLNLIIVRSRTLCY